MKVLENETADRATREYLFAFFHEWGLKRRSRNMRDYERGKQWIAEMGFTPTEYLIAINYLAEYLLI